MDISSMAGAIVAAQTGLARQEMSIQMVKQTIESSEAVVSLVTAATEQVQQAASGARGSVVDITA